MLNKAYEYLNRDTLHHADMLEALKREEAELIYADDEGVLIRSMNYGGYLISTESDTLMERFCDMITSPIIITTHQTRFLAMLKDIFGFNMYTICVQCAYLNEEKLESKLPDGIGLRELTLSDTDFVLEHYKNIPFREYIEERIEAGMLGAYCESGLVGFIGVHDDGSMGMLEVLPEYRRRGIALSLEVALINRLIEQKKLPYAQIVSSNDKSARLQEKLGMSFSDKTLAWVFNR